MRMPVLELMLGLAVASPAAAAGGIKIPEPGEAVLFLIGLAGLALGHRIGRHRHQKRDDDNNT